jgi:tetratricopeptide (TPR) repeat protein
MKYKNIFILFFLFLISIVLAETSKIEKAIELINSGKYDEAIGILKENNGKSSILLSIAYLEKKDFINAKKFALESWSQEDVLSNYILALISEEEKDYEQAIIYWSNVLKNTQDNSLKQLAKKHINVIKKIVR